MTIPWTSAGPAMSEMAEVVHIETQDLYRFYAWPRGWLARNRTAEQAVRGGATSLDDAKSYIDKRYPSSHFTPDPNSFDRLMEPGHAARTDSRI